MSASIKIVFLLTALAGAAVLARGIPITDSSELRMHHISQTSDISNRAEKALQGALKLAVTEDPALAREKFTNAMQLWLQIPEPGKAARAALQMGDAFRAGRKYQDSLDCYEQALDVHPLERETQVTVLYSIAKVYSDLYQRDLALAYYGRAIKLAKEISDNTGRSLSLVGLADLHYRDGDTNQSLACIAQARRFASAKLGVGDEAHIAHLAGEIYTDRGSLDRARQAFDEALAIYERAGDEDGQINVISSKAHLQLVLGHVQLALQQADQAVDWAESRAARAANNTEALNAREVRWRALLSHARAHRAVGEKETAIRSYRLAINHLEGLYWLVYVTTENSAIAFREKLQAPYRELVDVLIEEGRLQEAFESVERAKARAILGIVTARRTTGSRTSVDEQGSLRPLSESIARLRNQLGSSRITPLERARLEEKMKNARDAMVEARAKLEMKLSRNRNTWFQPASVKTLQGRMAETGETIIEFALGENRSFAWLLSARTVSLKILPARREIEKQVGNFIEVAGTAPNNMFLERDLAAVKEQGKALFSTLLGRLFDDVAPGKKLIIVPDGVLYYLPFESLLQGDGYLIENHEISYVSSASMLALWQDSRIGTGSGYQMELLAFGDPIFRTEVGKSSKKVGSRSHNVVTRPPVSTGSRLPRLPRTRDEVEDIARLFPSNRRKVYLDRDSSEYALKHEQLRRYRRVHFATHSLIDETSPSRSAVVLTPASDSEEDGLLELDEISDLDLDCDLVVLSACQTARGQLLSGEGILGLTRAFLYAGARSVVVSQWSVSDISTGQLMKNFYQNMVGNLSTAAALRTAKLEMLRSATETRHPYYWAAFILIGKP